MRHRLRPAGGLLALALASTAAAQTGGLEVVVTLPAAAVTPVVAASAPVK